MRSEKEGKEKNILVDRDEELNRLISSLDVLEENKGRTIFISGEEGVGKTRLIDEFKRIAKEKNLIVIEGSCEYGVSQPYLPFKRSFKDAESYYLFSKKLEEDEGILHIENKDMLEGQRQAAFYDTMMGLKDASREIPHVVILEDLHWAGQSTLNLFHYLTDRLKNEPILFIGTYNPGDAVPGDPFLYMKYLMSSKDIYEEVELDHFDIDNTEKLIKKISDVEDIPSEFLKKIHRYTSGNPLLIKESLHQFNQTDINRKEDIFADVDKGFPIPDSIKAVVERRVFRLDDKVRKTLQIGSVIGENIPFELLLKTTGLEELELLDHIDILTKNRIWKEWLDDDILAFSHSKMREVIYEGIGRWIEKQNIHSKVAKTLVEIDESEVQDSTLSLAEHYMKAEEYSAAFKYHLKAAKRAEEVYAFEDALKIYDRTLDFIEQLSESKNKRAYVYKQMAFACRVTGEYDKSRELLYETLQYVTDFKKEQDIHIQIVKTFQSHGRYEEALEVIEDRLSLEDQESLEKGELISRKGWSLCKMGQFDKAQEVFEEEMDLAKVLENDKFLAQAHHDLGSFAMMSHEFEKGLKHLEIARDIREELEDLRGLAITLNSLSGYHVMRGKLDEAVEELENCLNLYKEMNDKLHMSIVHNNIGLAYRKKGELDKAMEHFTRAYEFSELLGHKFKKGSRAMNLGLIHLMKGDIKPAETRLKEGKQLSEETKNLETKIESIFYLGRTELKKGDIEKAEKYLTELKQSIPERKFEKDQGLAESLKGEISTKKEKIDEAIESFSKAVEIFENSNAPDKKAISMYNLGVALKMKGENDKATEYLKSAVSYFEDRYMDLWAEKGRDQLG